FPRGRVAVGRHDAGVNLADQALDVALSIAHEVIQIRADCDAVRLIAARIISVPALQRSRGAIVLRHDVRAAIDVVCRRGPDRLANPPSFTIVPEPGDLQRAGSNRPGAIELPSA